jgi:hypothetical protein
MGNSKYYWGSYITSRASCRNRPASCLRRELTRQNESIKHRIIRMMTVQRRRPDSRPAEGREDGKAEKTIYWPVLVVNKSLDGRDGNRTVCQIRG